MKVLTIDQGNSHKIKAYSWEMDKSTKISLENQSFTDFDYAIYSSVISNFEQKEEIRKLSASVPLKNAKDFFQDHYFLEMPSPYAETIGSDRIITSYEVFMLYHQANTKNSCSLLIDAGSFLTLDIISKKGHHGGYILPGKRSWPNAYSSGDQLNHFQKDIEVILEQDELSKDLPLDSAHAMAQSLPLSQLGAIKELVHRFEVKRVIFTGGEKKLIDHLSRELKDREVTINETLIHQGLNRIAATTQRKV